MSNTGRIPVRQAAPAQARPIAARPAAVARPGGVPAAARPAGLPAPRAGWLKRGEDAAKGYEQEHAKQEERQARRASGADNAWRFFLKVGQSAEIVILDNSLD